MAGPEVGTGAMERGAQAVVQGVVPQFVEAADLQVVHEAGDVEQQHQLAKPHGSRVGIAVQVEADDPEQSEQQAGSSAVRTPGFTA